MSTCLKWLKTKKNDEWIFKNIKKIGTLIIVTIPITVLLKFRLYVHGL